MLVLKRVKKILAYIKKTITLIVQWIYLWMKVRPLINIEDLGQMESSEQLMILLQRQVKTQHMVLWELKVMMVRTSIIQK